MDRGACGSEARSAQGTVCIAYSALYRLPIPYRRSVYKNEIKQKTETIRMGHGALKDMGIGRQFMGLCCETINVSFWRLRQPGATLLLLF